MPVGRKPTYKDDAPEWVRLYVQEEKSLSEIAEPYGCAPSTVWRWLQLHGVEMRPAQLPPGYKDTRIPQEQIDETVRLYKSGLTLAQVGDELFLSPSAVHNRLVRAGVKRRKSNAVNSFTRKHPPQYHREMKQAIFLYTRMEWSFEEIGRLQNHNGHTIAKRFRRAGLPIRSRSESMRLRFKRHPKRSTSNRST
jgi:hypothetical protein